MKLQKAASTAAIMVVIHMVLQASICAINIARILSSMRNMGPNSPIPWTYLLTPLYYLAPMILDIALLITFITLAKTKEQLIRESQLDL